MKKILLTIITFFYINFAHGEEYKHHKMWSYKTRCGEETSKILINSVDETEKYGFVYHISVFNVKMQHGASKAEIKILPYLAVTRKSLDESLIELTATRYPYQPFLKEHIKWKEALKEGTEIVHNAPIASVLESIESRNRDD